MKRVVADTNVLISAIVFGGLPALFLSSTPLRSFTLVTSPTLLDELDRKLRSKFSMPGSEADVVRSRFERIAIMVIPAIVLNVVSGDPDDNRVLECAVTANADCIVSGDRHLLKIVSFQGIPVLTVRQFMETLPAPDPQ